MHESVERDNLCYFRRGRNSEKRNRFCILVWVSVTNVIYFTLQRWKNENPIILSLIIFVVFPCCTDIQKNASLICLVIATLLAVGRNDDNTYVSFVGWVIRYTLRHVERTYDVRADRHPRELLELPSRMHPYFTWSPRGLINNECITREVFVLVI